MREVTDGMAGAGRVEVARSKAAAEAGAVGPRVGFASSLSPMGFLHVTPSAGDLVRRRPSVGAATRGSASLAG